MPIYEFACPECGIFSMSRPMAEASLPARCACSQLAERILSPPHLRGARRPGSEPDLVSTRNQEPRPPQPQHGHGRPWMLAH